MDIIQIYYRVRGKWWIVVAAILFSLAAGVAYLAVAPKIYSSQAVLQVQPKGEQILGASTGTEDDDVSPEVLKTVEAGLSSQSLLLRIVHSAHLASNPQFAPPKKNGEAYLDSELIALLQSKLSVEVRKGTRLIDVVAEDKDPKEAQMLVQTFISQYLEESFQNQLDLIEVSSGYLSGEVQRFWPDLPRIHDALEKNDPSELLQITSISSDTEVAALQTRIHAEEADFASTKEVFMENHPRYIAAKQRLDELRVAQQDAMVRAAERVQVSYDNAKEAETELAEKLRQQEAEIQQGQPPVPPEEMAQQVETDHALYDTVLTRMKQTPAPLSLNANPVLIVEQPLVESKPRRPHSSLVLAAALLVGMVMGVGLIVGQDFFTSAFTSVDDVEMLLGLPILATLPKSDLVAAGREGTPVDPSSIEAEAFRTLRTSIHQLESKWKGHADGSGKEIAHHAVLFTSANPGEGKTSCAYNYAIMLARQGLRTLLIDGDLRRAALTGLLKGGRKPGFSEVLSGHSTLASARLPTANENLTFLAAGSCDADTAELMASAKVQALVQEAATQFQRIVIDSPPVNSVSDSLLIVPHVLATCVVIQAGVTPRRAVERACMLVKLANRGVIGAILNQVGTDACSTYETHGYARNSNYTYAVRKI